MDTPTLPVLPAIRWPAAPYPAVDSDRDDISIVDKVDRYLHAAFARTGIGISPASLGLAFADWMTHLAWSPGKQAELLGKAVGKVARLATFAQDAARPDCARACIEPLPQDRRFRAPEWQQWPFNVVYQAFLLQQQWWHNATTGVRGVSRHHEEVVTFVTRQLLDMVSPSNFPWTNPVIWQATASSGGMNLLRGAGHAWEDLWRASTGARPRGTDGFAVGTHLAVTPGQVVFRNRLIELIQYSPATPSVHAEPLLIVPAWIMKYYILDLSPANSLIRYLVERGYTVFTISWLNPGRADRDLSLDDYLELGFCAALDAVGAITGAPRIHAVGYCLGGTLAAIGAAMLARDGDSRLASLTLLAAETDFSEPGELGLFIDESQLAFLDDAMWARGFLDASQMAGAFQMLRSADLIWSRSVEQYLVGVDDSVNDLMAWNADTTRMPYRMHSEYLRRLFLHNDLAAGRFPARGRPVSLGDLRLPLFVVGTTMDHVAPWRSVYKLHMLSDAELTFVLTNGGHNAGIVSEPDRPGRMHKLSVRDPGAQYVDPEAFLRTAVVRDGSWWVSWLDWLDRRSGPNAAPPPLGSAAAGYPVLGPAPGTYVLQR